MAVSASQLAQSLAAEVLQLNQRKALKILAQVPSSQRRDRFEKPRSVVSKLTMVLK